MHPSKLHVVTAISNPILLKSRINLALAFIEHMLAAGVHLTVVEAALGEREHELAHVKGIHHVPVRSRTLVWNKESLLNLGIARLPDHAQAIGIFDADIEFRSKSWATDTVHALQQYDVVQPWSDCYDLGPRGEHLEHHRSFCRIYHDGQPIMQGPNAKDGPYKFAHPGYAWAFTRHALNAVGGLIWTAALGAGDHHMAMALIGRVKDSIPGDLDPSYSVPLKLWEHRAQRHIAGNIGYVHGTIEHGWHGPKASRKYVDRWGTLRKHNFNPTTDLITNTHGVVELSCNKPGLRQDMDRYFRQRDEDLTVL